MLWGCGDTGNLVHCWWDCEMVQLLWKKVWTFLKKLNRTTIRSNNSISGYMPQRIESRDSNRYLYTIVYSRIIHNSQKDGNNPNVHWQMDKMWYMHTMEYYSGFKEEWNSVTCYNMDDPWGHYSKWNNSDTKGQILYEATYISKIMKFIETK